MSEVEPDAADQSGRQEMFFGLPAATDRDLEPELAEQLARRRREQLLARGAVTVTLPPSGVLYAHALAGDGRDGTVLATTGEVEVPAGHVLALGLDGADEHADAVATLQHVAPDVLGPVSIGGVGARTLHKVAMLDWPRLMPPAPGRRGPMDGALRLELAVADLTALAARWPAALQLELPPGAAEHDAVDGIVLHGVDTLHLRAGGTIDRLVARLPRAAADLSTLVLEPESLDDVDWSPLRELGSLRSLSVFHGQEPAPPPVPVGVGATALLSVAVALPRLRELTLYTSDGIGAVDATGCSVSLEELAIGAGSVEGSTVLSTSRLLRLRVLSVDGADDDTSRATLMRQIALEGSLPDLIELNLRGGEMDADDADVVLAAEDELMAARSGLSVNGIQFAPSVLA